MGVLGVWWGILIFAAVLFLIGVFSTPMKAYADDRVRISEFERYRLAREIAEQQYIEAARVGASGARPKQELYYPEKGAAPAVSREEIEGVCGIAPSDECIHQYFNMRFEETSKGFRK